MPRILNRKEIKLSRWMSVIEKTVQFEADEEPEIYHCISQAAYVGMVVQVENGSIPIVRQYRPSVEEFTWEFPAGTVDLGETPEQAARRELQEEAGLLASEVFYLGNFYPDTGRSQVDSHGFYIHAVAQQTHFVPPQGMEVRYVSHPELQELMRSGVFRHQLHLALYATALINGMLSTG